MKIDVDVEKLILRLKELVNYEGYLPWLIRFRMPRTVSMYYLDNLMKKGLSDKYADKFIKSKTFNWDDSVEEFNEWIKNNPEFKDLVKYIDEDEYNTNNWRKLIPESYRNWIYYLTVSDSTKDKNKMLQKWYVEDPEHFNEWLKWAKDITGPELFESTSFE